MDISDVPLAEFNSQVAVSSLQFVIVRHFVAGRHYGVRRIATFAAPIFAMHASIASSKKAAAVNDAAAIFVGAVIHKRIQELFNQVAVGAVGSTPSKPAFTALIAALAKSLYRCFYTFSG